MTTRQVLGLRLIGAASLGLTGWLVASWIQDGSQDGWVPIGIALALLIFWLTKLMAG